VMPDLTQRHDKRYGKCAFHRWGGLVNRVPQRETAKVDREKPSKRGPLVLIMKQAFGGRLHWT